MSSEGLIAGLLKRVRVFEPHANNIREIKGNPVIEMKLIGLASRCSIFCDRTLGKKPFEKDYFIESSLLPGELDEMKAYPILQLLLGGGSRQDCRWNRLAKSVFSAFECLGN